MSTGFVSNEDLDKAAASFDGNASTASVHSENNTNNKDDAEPKTVAGMLSAVRTHANGSGVDNPIQKSLHIMSMADGSDKKGDILIDDKDEALQKLKELIEEDRLNSKLKSKKRVKWSFRASPHEYFGKTLDDTFTAFVVWAKRIPDDNNNKKNKINGNDESKNNNIVSYNVSKAFRRIESYAEWMEEHADEIINEPLTADSVKDALKAWGVKFTTSKDGHFVWWVDLGQLDDVAIKKRIPLSDSFRLFVWYGHLSMYDTNAQENGLVFVETVDKIGFLHAITLMPMKLKEDVNKLTLGTLPIKMHALYILETPTWMDIFMNFMFLFMSKKMRKRINILKDWNKIEELMGKDCIPKNFGKLEGSIEHDLVATMFFSK